MLNKFFILAAGTIIMLVVMVKTGAILKTNNTPHGILNLEFASNTQTVNAILQAWQKTTTSNNIKAATINTLLDFIFLVFYSLFLNKLCNIIADKLSGLLAVAGRIIAYSALAAGVLDIIENTGMLLSLNGYINSATAIITFTAASIKWLLVVAILLYVMVGGLIALVKKSRNEASLSML
jgi:hypothetical protein